MTVDRLEKADTVHVCVESRAAGGRGKLILHLHVPTFTPSAHMYRYVEEIMGHPVLLSGTIHCDRPTLVTSDDFEEAKRIAECSNGIISLIYMKVPSLSFADLVNHGAELLNSIDPDGALACFLMADGMPGTFPMEQKRLVFMGRIFLLSMYGMVDLDRAERYFLAAAVVEYGSYYVNALYNLGHVNRIRAGQEEDDEARSRLLASARAYYGKAEAVNGHPPSARWLAKMGKEGN